MRDLEMRGMAPEMRRAWSDLLCVSCKNTFHCTALLAPYRCGRRLGGVVISSVSFFVHKKNRIRGFFMESFHHSNSELGAVFVLNPLGSLASTRPRLACRRITVLRGHLGTRCRTAARFTRTLARRKNVLRGQPIFGHQLLNLRHCV